MKYSKCKEIDSLVTKLVKRGWLFHRGRKHGKILHPTRDGKIIVPKTPSDSRAYRNFRGEVRRLLNAIEMDPH